MAYYQGPSSNPPMRQGNARGYQGPPPNDYDYPPRGPGQQQQWPQNGYGGYGQYDANDYNDYQAGPYSDQRQQYQQPAPPDNRPYGQPREQGRRSYDYPQPAPNDSMHYNARPEPRANLQDRGQRLGPRDPNMDRPQSSRQYNGRNQYDEGYREQAYREPERQVRSALAGDYNHGGHPEQDYGRGYESRNPAPRHNSDPRQQYPQDGAYDFDGRPARAPQRNGDSLVPSYGPDANYSSQNDYREQWSEPPRSPRGPDHGGRTADRQQIPKRPSPSRVDTSQSQAPRKPLLDVTSPSEMNYDNPFPVFPTKKNGLKAEDGTVLDATAGRPSQETRRPDLSTGQTMTEAPDPTQGSPERTNTYAYAGQTDGRQPPRTETLPIRPIETNFSRNFPTQHRATGSESNGPGNYSSSQWQEPGSAVDFQAPRAQFAMPPRPGSAPGVRSTSNPSLVPGPVGQYANTGFNAPPSSYNSRPPIGRQMSDTAYENQVPQPYGSSNFSQPQGHEYSRSSEERMPNFDKAGPTSQQGPAAARNAPLHATSSSISAPNAVVELPAGDPQYARNGPRSQSQENASWQQPQLAPGAGRDNAYSELAADPYRSESGYSRPQDDFGSGLQRAATSYEEPLRPPPPQRIMTADSHFSDPGMRGPPNRAPGSMPRPPYNDPRSPPRGPPGGPDNFRRDGPAGPPRRPDQASRDYDMPVQPNRGFDGGRPPVNGNRGFDAPSNGPGFAPRGSSSQANPNGRFPDRQQSFGRDVNAPRGSDTEIQLRPPPVRPGLSGSSSSMGASRPPPVRQYDLNNSSRGPPNQRQAPESHRSSLDKPARPPPVTQQDLSRLREAVRANPGSNKAQMELAKKLVEASVVLADEGGKADSKTAARNKAAYTAEAHRIVKKLVASGYPEAMFFLADSLSSGSLGLENDPKEAFNLYQLAAKAGHPAAAYRTAVCCEIGPEDGGGTRKDPLKAMQWYKRAAALGDVPAMYKLGMIQLKGHLGQPKNLIEGCTWLKRAADKADEENPHAVHELACLYESGEGPGNMGRDPAQALQLFTQAAKLGHKASQFRLGQAYEYGLIGCPIDARNSIVWYTRAAAQGEHQSELALSGWYLTGSDGILEHSDTEAYLWARKAASAAPPLPKAMFAMGYFTEVGIGCPRSLEEAKKWYGRAASHRFPKAQERLEELKKGGLKASGGREKLSRTNKQQTDQDCVVM